MIVCLRLDGFYTRRFENDGRPLVVLRDKVVLDCDQPASSRGVQVGMTQREAKSVLFDGRFEQWDVDEFREAQAAWLDACCEFSDAVEPVDQHMAFVDLSLHPDPVDILQQMAYQVGYVSGCRVVSGCARVKWLASVALGEGDYGRAYSDPAGFLSDLHTMRLEPIPIEHRERLVMLGYHTAGAVAELPMKVLQAQFGDDAVTIYRCLRGGCSEPVLAAYPQRCLSSRFRFDDPTDSLEAIDNALVRLSTQLGKRLMADDLQGCDLHVVAVREEGEQRIERRYAKPIQSKASVLFCLRRLVEELASDLSNRPDSSDEYHLSPEAMNRWTGIRVRMPNLALAKRKQANLYTQKATDQLQAADFAMSQLHKTFGMDSIVLAAQVAESRRKRVLKVWKDAIGWA